MGAEVIKCERPGSGDDTRIWGPPFVGDQSVYFLAVNRNKRSVTVDMKHPSGRRVIERLAAESDVLVENFVPGKLAELGLDYESLRKINPRLIYCSITGFGPDGPYARRAAYDVPVSALSGLLSITGHPDGPPAKVGVALTDVITGLHAYGAILAALHSREHTGVGQRIDTSLIECALSSLVNAGANALIADVEMQRWGTAHASVVPYQAFSATDGDLVIAAANDGQYRRLCEVIGRPEMAVDSRYATNAARVANRAEVDHAIAEYVSTRERAGLLTELASAGLAVTPVNTIKEALADPQVQHREMIMHVQHPTIGDLPLIGKPVKMSNDPAGNKAAPPPLLGEHTHEVLTGLLGYTDAEVEEGHRDGWL